MLTLLSNSDAQTWRTGEMKNQCNNWKTKSYISHNCAVCLEVIEKVGVLSKMLILFNIAI